MKNEFYYPSKDGNTEIHTIEWKPEGEVRGIIQICHGMSEYVERYDEFARFLCANGYYVVGNDHLGHGRSVQSNSEYGYFSEKYGNICLIGDMHALRQRTAKKYPDLPYFMLGHSMGSALVRQYIQLYGNGLAGVILMGIIADHSRPVLCAGKGLCRVLRTFRGGHYRSRVMDRMVTGPYNKKYKPARTRADWITSDEERLEKYVNDPLCSFTFTVNAYYNLLHGLQKIRHKENLFMMPKRLSILLLSGSDDPVGKNGKGIVRLYERYKRLGVRDVTFNLYQGDRHELLNETDRQQVMSDINEWLDEHMPKK